MNNQAIRRTALGTAALLLTACVGSELEIPANHPGHASANTGKIYFSSALRKELDLSVDDSAPPTSGHAGHEHHSEASPSDQVPKGTTYVCPMHPEVVRETPGACPICGMKLVPKKEEK